MRCAQFFRLLPCVWLLAAFAGAWNAAAQGASDKPNVVVILTDDAGYNEFGFTAAMNGLTTYAQTPNLDALAQQSMVFRQGYVSAQLCGPSRAGLLTGQYQQRFGAEENLDGSGQVTTIQQSGTFGLQSQQITIAQRLKDLGYSTGAIGKWHQGFAQGYNLPQDKGFDEFFGFWGGSRDYFFDLNAARTMRRGTAAYESQYRTQGDPSKYDPTRGRYVTDAFAEESIDFINRHANDENPFFLYTAFTNPHWPAVAKASDLSQFTHIADPTQRTIAAMQYAVDRSIGDILNSLATNGIDQNTIVVFVNDNGGFSADDNRPYQGYKGLAYEGGIRVPFLIKAPGLEPGIYDPAVSTLDVLPTILAAAGGDLSQIPTDGVDLMPRLKGEDTSSPHEVLHWRVNNIWAVRKGDWKLGSPTGGAYRLTNMASDPAEITNLYTQHPNVVADLLRELTYWEAKLEKPKWGVLGADNQNKFDHFVFRRVAQGSNWFDSGQWIQAGTSNVVTLTSADAYANSILEFPVSNTGPYATYNNKWRLTGQEVMLNQLRFTGNFTDTKSSWGFIGRNALVLTKNLTGQNPQIRLDATATGNSNIFSFTVDNELILLDDLELTGDGTQYLGISGQIRDFYEPRNVIKTGTSTIHLLGNNTFKGNLTVEGGQLRVTGAGTINGTNAVHIGSAGKLVLDSGTIAVNSIDNFNGGEFDFRGGTLKVVDFFGDLTNNGGNYSPGASPASSVVYGNYSQTGASKLTMELGGTMVGLDYDQLLIAGSAALAGTLLIDIFDGFMPQQGDIFSLIVSAGGISGTFTNTILPALSGGLTWRLAYTPSMVELIVGPPEGSTINPVPGDYNGNGTVDAADYVVWRNSFGSTSNLAADGDNSGAVDANDLTFWRARFGNVAPIGSGSVATVPEPTSVMLFLVSAMALWTGIRSAAQR